MTSHTLNKLLLLSLFTNAATVNLKNTVHWYHHDTSVYRIARYPNGYGHQWAVSWADCRGRDMHLVVINDGDENEFLTLHAERTLYYWIGLWCEHGDCDLDALSWVDGSSVSYKNLADPDKEPMINPYVYYLYPRTGLWGMTDKQQGYWSIGYICEKPDGCQAANPCSNGGTCQGAASEAGYGCHCAEGYTGTDCETSFNDEQTGQSNENAEISASTGQSSESHSHDVTNTDHKLAPREIRTGTLSEVNCRKQAAMTPLTISLIVGIIVATTIAGILTVLLLRSRMSGSTRNDRQPTESSELTNRCQEDVMYTEIQAVDMVQFTEQPHQLPEMTSVYLDTASGISA